jgi:butyryl-CoA dehydrogenase
LAEKFVSEKNIKFLLYEVLDVLSLTRHAYYAEYSRRLFDMVLAECLQLSRKLLWPIFDEMDRHPPELKNGKVRVHPQVKSILKAFGEGGWISSTTSYEAGGEQLPHMIADACQYVFAAANYSASAYPGLCSGAAGLIESYGSPKLRAAYVPKMRAGEWQGTMALTEPEAGSSLADIATTAYPTGREFFRIKGQKIFISAGDHDCAENVVHLMLARIEGAPPGVKGISLFVVPKMRPADDGGLVSNDVAASGIYHKLGYRGCPIVQLSIGDRDDSRGWLVGEPHNGLRYMFQMMNEARIGVGLGAASMATAAYYAALEYAKTRRQGRRLGQKDLALPQVPIIEHPDVKRMLLFQRAVIEGSLSLLFQCSRYVDLQKVLSGEEKEKYGMLLDLLTPVAKTYPSEMGIQAISQGLQCFGGAGYCDDYPLQQYYRDARIHPIHEGATAIQAMDLLGRKVLMQEGRAFGYYVQEVRAAIERARAVKPLAAHADQLEEALQQLERLTGERRKLAQEQGAEVFLADATLYLELFGMVSIAWQWLLQGTAAYKALENTRGRKDAAFYRGKTYALRYFFSYELPGISGLVERLQTPDRLTVDIGAEAFSD